MSDLLDYITPDAEMKAREAQKKQARAKVELVILIMFLVSFVLACTENSLFLYSLKEKLVQIGRL